MVYFKFFPPSLILRGFQYIIGNNKDIHPFDSSNECKIGGLYYTDIHNLHLFEKYGPIIGIIEIPSNVVIVKIDDKYKSPEINIIEFFDYKEFLSREDLYLEEKKKITSFELLFKMPYLQTFEMAMEAVKQDGYNFRFVNPKLQTGEMAMEAVKQNGYMLKYVNPDLQTAEIAMEAIGVDGHALKYVKREFQTQKMCKLAVQQDRCALKYVKVKGVFPNWDKCIND